MGAVRRVVSAVLRRRVLAIVLAVVVVLTLGIGAGAVWATAPAPSMAGGPVVQVERNGLRLTLSVGPGPYFLSELVAVTVSVTNLGSTAVTVAGQVGGDLSLDAGCGSILGVTESGGHAPTYQAPTTGGMSCPGPVPSKLVSGQMATATGVLPVTASGTVGFSAHMAALAVATEGGGAQSYTAYTGWDPFAGHWPTVKLTVSPTVPAGRTILLTRFGTRVFIIAPPEALSRLYYEYSASVSTRSDTCVTGSYGWGQIKTPWVDYLPWCGGYGTWTFAVGAPGYAIAQGSVSP